MERDAGHIIHFSLTFLVVRFLLLYATKKSIIIDICLIYCIFPSNHPVFYAQRGTILEQIIDFVAFYIEFVDEMKCFY
jgi:hypothetical protein